MSFSDRARNDIFIYVKGLSLQKVRWGLFLLLVVSVLWLLIAGQWELFLPLFFASMVMPLVYEISIWPMRQFIPILFKDIIKRNKKAVSWIGFLSALYVGILATGWTVGMHQFAVLLSKTTTVIPLILAGYACAVGSVAFGIDSKREDSNLGVSFLLTFVSLLYITISLMSFFSISFWMWLWLPPIFFAIISMDEELLLARKKKKKILEK